MVKWLSLAALAVCPACGCEAPAPVGPEPVRLEQVWRLGGFANPESVALSADGTTLYVTNVNGEGEAEDGNGFISRVSRDGQMLDREWARGLDAPKGIAIVGDLVYVADISDIVVLSAADGSLRQRIAAPGAGFLNDLAVTNAGLVLIADSGTQRIYIVRAAAAEVWLEDDLLESVNGLLPEQQRLVVTTMAGRLLAVDYETRAISVLAEGLGEADGVAPLGDGRYLVSEWPGVMHVVGGEGAVTNVLDTRDEGRLLNDFLRVGDAIYQPHWEPSELTSYRLVQGAP